MSVTNLEVNIALDGQIEILVGQKRKAQTRLDHQEGGEAGLREQETATSRVS